MEKPEAVPAGGLSVLIEHLRQCTDFRDVQRIDYSLVELLFLTFCATLCGCEGYNEIADFGRYRLAWLRQYLPYANGSPSHDTINRAMQLINARELEKIMTSWATYELQLPDGTIISLDGKWISRSATIKQQQTAKDQGGKQAVHMMNAYCGALNTCLTTMRIEGKLQEKQAAEAILDLLEISQCIITLDAGGCHRDTVAKIREREADYVISLKGNQTNTAAATTALFEQQAAHDVYEAPVERNHGRQERRRCSVLYLDALPAQYVHPASPLAGWQDLRTLVCIQAERHILSTGKTEADTRYFISSLRLPAAELAAVARAHWSVENNLHWFLDVVLGEDQSRKRAGFAAANYSVIKKMALNQLKAYTKDKRSIKRRMKVCAMSDDYLDDVLRA